LAVISEVGWRRPRGDLWRARGALHMARRGFTPGGGSARSSQVQRPEPDACVVYYQHAYPL